jgi:3-keto-disaccharide hydrolase
MNVKRILASMTLATVLILAAGLITVRAQSAALTAAEQKDGWKLLFDGKTTNGWTPRPPPAGRGATEPPPVAKWVVENGEIVWVKDSGRGYLVTNQPYGDFILRADFWVDPAANSGINIGVPDTGNISSNTSFEINIFDDTEQFPTGSINNVQRTAVAKPQTANKWNTLEITRQGDHVVVAVNGEKAVDIRSALHPGGLIGLQAPAAGTTKFRNVRIKTL